MKKTSVKKQSTSRQWLYLLISVVLCEIIGIVGGLFTVDAIPSWYATLIKPALNPPAWIFGPVWTLLYLMMGVSLFLVLKNGFNKMETKKAVGLFGFQLLFNLFWSIIFFTLHNPGFALVDIAIMWISILATIVQFSKISRTAAWMLVPYLLWVSFASYLNFSIWILNR